ncbi:MAG: hypothetical protein CEO12_630 [Parcubacteria group bacterium Gr01-1014_46]|nr:MAG: hypothetical protein CEO12_630 [Parcubacteria group bacterium Gr01-1014_46]
MYQSLDEVQKRRFFNGVFAVIVLLAVFLGIQSLNSFKESSYIGKGAYAVNTITVSGKGEVFAIPDTGSFSFSVVEEGKSVKEAQDKASKKMNAILDAVKSMGVEEKDIKTIGYSSYPKYDYDQGRVCTTMYCPPGKQVLIGYEVSQNISIKVRNTDQAGDVLTKVGGLGASNISGLNFVVDDEEKVQAEARNKAIADAKAKAKVLADSLGVDLVAIVNFSESGNYPIPYYGGMVAEKVMGMGSDSAVPPQLPVGENEIVSNVSITYEIK